MCCWSTCISVLSSCVYFSYATPHARIWLIHMHLWLIICYASEFSCWCYRSPFLSSLWLSDRYLSVFRTYFVLYYSYLIYFISISTLPSHTYSTILSFAKVTCNTHKNKKLLSIPLKLVPSLAKLPLPYFPPSTGRSASSHSKLVIPFFAAVLGGCSARRFPYFRS